jgi:hypothetical protein
MSASQSRWRGVNREFVVRAREGDHDRRATVLPLGLLLILVGATACAGTSTSPSASTGPIASTEASSAPASSAPPSASPSASEPVGERYTTTSFAVPLTVIVEPLLKSPPIADTTNFLTWNAAADANEKIRFLIPAEVYPPRGGGPEPPPTDYLAYLQGQASYGAEFSDVSTNTVDGHAATLMTATTTESLNGSLGCPVIGVDNPEHGGVGECFGLQPDVILRIAVIDMGGGTTLLAWARTGIAAPDDEFNAMFERMLANLQFN